MTVSTEHQKPLQSGLTKSKASVCLVLLVLVVFGITLGGDFVGDDRFMIVKNEYLGDPELWKNFFTEDSWAGSGGATTNYRPLPLLSYGGNYWLGGLEPLGYHLVNLGLHMVVALLVFALGSEVGLSTGGAFFGAAVFAIHPIQTEAVAGIFGRMDLMAAAFFLAALLSHMVARGHEASGESARLARWAAVSFYLGAVLSKEHVVVFPVVALAYDWLWGCLERKGAWKQYVGYGVVATVYMSVWVLLFGGKADGFSPLDNALAHVDASARVVSALEVTGLYLKHLLYPVGLSPDYSYRVILPISSALSGAGVLAILGAILVLVVGIWLGRRSRIAALALALTVSTFFLVSNLAFPIGTAMGDRLFYLPMAGIGLLVGLGWDSLTKSRLTSMRWVLVASVVVLSLLSILQAMHWKDDFALLRYAATVSPESAKVQNNLGYEFLARERLGEASHHFRRSLDIYPTYYRPLEGLAAVAYREGDLEAALDYSESALELAPDPEKMLGLMGNIHRQRGRLDLARASWEALLAREPNDPETLSNLGILEWQEGDTDKALEYWLKATEDSDAPAGVWLNLARAYEELGDREGARRMYEEHAARRGKLSSDPSSTE
jgi:Flp pilus assembly protein TadD